MGYVYKHIRLDKNEVFYIGMSDEDPKNKYRRAYSKYDRNKFWKNIVKKTEYRVEIILLSKTNVIIDLYYYLTVKFNK